MGDQRVMDAGLQQWKPRTGGLEPMPGMSQGQEMLNSQANSYARNQANPMATMNAMGGLLGGSQPAPMNGAVDGGFGYWAKPAGPAGVGDNGPLPAGAYQGPVNFSENVASMGGEETLAQPATMPRAQSEQPVTGTDGNWVVGPGPASTNESLTQPASQAQRGKLTAQQVLAHLKAGARPQARGRGWGFGT